MGPHSSLSQPPRGSGEGSGDTRPSGERSGASRLAATTASRRSAHRRRRSAPASRRRRARTTTCRRSGTAFDDVCVDASRPVELGELDDLFELLPAGLLRALADTRAELRWPGCQLLYRGLRRLPSGKVRRVREVVEDELRRPVHRKCLVNEDCGPRPPIERRCDSLFVLVIGFLRSTDRAVAP
jgi:hypothetical protein